MPTKGKMTPGPWQVVKVEHAVNEDEVSVYADRRKVATGLTDADAEAVAYLPDLIDNGRKVVNALMQMFKHPSIVEVPSSASLLISQELAELRRMLATVKL